MCVRNEEVVPPARFQRATSRLGGERSMQLSYGSSRANSIKQTAENWCTDSEPVLNFEWSKLMARLEQIIEEARSLSLPEKRKLRQALDAELAPREPHSPARPNEGSNSDDDATRARRLEWLKVNREQYAGQYVALAGDELVGHGRTIREAHDQAKEKGIENPFLVRLTSESEVLFAGW